MKSQLVTALCILAALVGSSLQDECVQGANCTAPACRCASTNNPGGFTLANTPQIVFLSFDGAITESTVANYTKLLDGRINPNGCPISATFFTSHEYNDYVLTRGFYMKGHEIASFTMSSAHYQSNYWQGLTATEWTDEINGMKTAIARYSNIPAAAIKGSRAPYLQTGGDAYMQALKNSGITYDASYPTYTKTSPPIWPYTMDFGLQQECTVEPCPKNSFPGIWAVPMVTLTDLNNTKQSMADGYRPSNQNETYQYLLTNFQRHYTSNKAPFGIYLNANSWFGLPELSYRFAGFEQFLNFLKNLDDVYVVSIGKGVEWMKNPVNLAGSGATNGPFNCPSPTAGTCASRKCYYDESASSVGFRTLGSCITCPDFYPWVRNPLGNAP